MSLASCIGLAGEIQIGNYLVRYNALHSENLTPDIAKRVGISQNAKNIVVILNVQKPGAGSALNTVAAEVSGSARDLLGNTKSLTFKQVKEAGAIDYMAQTQIQNEQTVVFDLSVTPDGGPSKKLQFQQKFYVSPE